jgi:hypothetical protein
MNKNGRFVCHMVFLSALVLAGSIACGGNTAKSRSGAKPSHDKTVRAGADRKPFLLIMEAADKNGEVAAAWEGGLGRADDIVSSAPLSDNRDKVGQIKTGQHAWMSPSAEKLIEWAKKAEQTDRGLKWLFYDIEGWEDTPAAERNNPVAALKTLQALCKAHKWKLAVIPGGKFNTAAAAVKFAPHCDAIILQCQKKQNARGIKMMRAAAEEIRKVNPHCLVGAQLGVGVPSNGYGGIQGAVAFYKATRDVLDLYSVWWGSEKDMINLLKTLGNRKGDNPAGKGE